MKSQYGDRDTIGTQLLKTQKEHENMKPICAGELSEQMGKDMMARVLDIVEVFNGIVPKLYIETSIQKDPIFIGRSHTFSRRISQTVPLMQANQDVYCADYINQTFEHVWGVPSRSEFDMVLNNPSPDNAKNIVWIKDYLKLEKKANKKIVA